MARIVARPTIVSSGGGGDAYDGFAAYSELWRSENYSSSGVAAPYSVNGSGPNAVQSNYLSTGGYGGSGCYEISISQHSPDPAAHDRQHAYGWPWTKNIPNSTIPAVRSSYVMSIKFKIWFSAKFLTECLIERSPQWLKAKIMDNWCYNYAGSLDGSTRQTIFIQPVRIAEAGYFSPPGVTVQPGVYLGLANGGAGQIICQDGVRTPFDFSDYPEEFIEVQLMLSCADADRRTAVYVKRAGQPIVTSVSRPGSMDSTTGPYVYSTDDGSHGYPAGTCHGWYQSNGAALFGYWQDLYYTFSPLPTVRLDDISLANGWQNFTI